MKFFTWPVGERPAVYYIIRIHNNNLYDLFFFVILRFSIIFSRSVQSMTNQREKIYIILVSLKTRNDNLLDEIVYCRIFPLMSTKPQIVLRHSYILHYNNYEYLRYSVKTKYSWKVQSMIWSGYLDFFIKKF